MARADGIALSNQGCRLTPEYAPFFSFDVVNYCSGERHSRTKQNRSKSSLRRRHAAHRQCVPDLQRFLKKGGRLKLQLLNSKTLFGILLNCSRINGFEKCLFICLLAFSRFTLRMKVQKIYIYNLTTERVLNLLSLYSTMLERWCSRFISL